MNSATLPSSNSSPIQVNGGTKLIGLIAGDPSLSLSPRLHNTVFSQRGLNWCYLPLRVSKARPEGIEQALKGLKSLSFQGVNVTTPFKQAVLPYLESLSEEARAVEAVNCIKVMKNGQLQGHNTDSLGFRLALERAQVLLEGQTVCVLGAGGAARAVVRALTCYSLHKLIVVNRTLERADNLLNRVPSTLNTKALIPGELSTYFSGFPPPDVIVNVTSVGSLSGMQGSPWPETLPLSSTQTVVDLVYTPVMTPLLKRAKIAGATIVDGLDMLAYQAALSYAYWTEQEPPFELMLRTAGDVRCSAV